jgi:hypothetical protein
VHSGTAQRAEHPLQGWPNLLVAVGRHDHGRQVDHPAPDVAQHVEGGVVGPVDVLENKDGRTGAVRQVREQRGEHRVAVARGQCRGERPTGAADRVTQRAQGARRDEVVARTEQDAGPVGPVEDEGADEARLTDAGLPRDQHDRPRTSRGPA